jgi:hypothetical protein
LMYVLRIRNQIMTSHKLQNRNQSSKSVGSNWTPEKDFEINPQKLWQLLTIEKNAQKLHTNRTITWWDSGEVQVQQPHCAYLERSSTLLRMRFWREIANPIMW